MKQYRLTIAVTQYYEKVIKASDHDAAWDQANDDIEDGDWGKPNEISNVEVYDVSEVRT